MDYFTSYEALEKARVNISNQELYFWMNYSLLSWQWWVLIIATILPWFIWYKIVDKFRFFEILTYGFYWMITSVLLDSLGTTLNLWSYPINLVFLITPLIPADCAVIPVTYMILYQYTKGWKTFFLGSLIISFVISFIIEPLFIYYDMLKFYDSYIRWSHTKSFISFIVISLFLRIMHKSVIKRVYFKRN